MIANAVEERPPGDIALGIAIITFVVGVVAPWFVLVVRLAQLGLGNYASSGTNVNLSADALLWIATVWLTVAAAVLLGLIIVERRRRGALVLSSVFLGVALGGVWLGWYAILG
jgi:hypothetical protein